MTLAPLTPVAARPSCLPHPRRRPTCEHRAPAGRPVAPTEAPSLAERLALVPLLLGVEPARLSALARDCSLRSVPPGFVLSARGDTDDGLLLLLTGQVAVHRDGPAGALVILRLLDGPTLVPEAGLLDRTPRSVCVVAVGPVTAVVLPRGAVVGLLAEDPALAGRLLSDAADSVRALTDRTTDQALLDLPGRLASLLVRLTGHGETVLELTQARLAEMVGGTRQSVNLALRAFEARGHVQRQGRELRVLDRAALQRRGAPDGVGRRLRSCDDAPAWLC